MDLEMAVRELDAVEANVSKLEAVWLKMREVPPEAGADGLRTYRQLGRDFESLRAAIPSIDRKGIAGRPPTIAPTPGALQAVGDEIDDYRHRLHGTRRQIVRQRIDELVVVIDATLSQLLAAEPVEGRTKLCSPDWELLGRSVAEVDRLRGAEVRSSAWGQLRRHLAWAEQNDLASIAREDWPSVKAELRRSSHAPTEPLPVGVTDLAQLAAARPAGSVAVGLRWDVLDGVEFERLLYNIVDKASGYENAQWLMAPNAPDSGRDISVWRVHQDALAGALRARVFIQCKHTTKGISDVDIAAVVTKVSHWEPPAVDVLVIATSGNLTKDGTSWVERRNHAGERPRIEPWTHSHLEALLARRPDLTAAFGLR